ncbi:MAG: hypothetical protein GX451_10330 [Acholeplasmataceae bacterium]|nr:hypothetical protein [Acholeplasmataceae bacterium]
MESYDFYAGYGTIVIAFLFDIMRFWVDNITKIVISNVTFMLLMDKEDEVFETRKENERFTV